VRADLRNAPATAASARSSASWELIIALSVAWCLVIARCFVYIRYEQAFFDSDQAIIGLMAKHLAEGRAFPLFFYGQPYLLGVEAWLAAPVFWIAGASVSTLHASLTLTNLAVVTLLIVGLWRGAGLRPFYGLAAATFFAFAPPLTTAFLIQANGANIEPFLFLLILWFVRDRPLWFGVILGIGFRTREFTIYAVPVLLAAQLIDGRLFQSKTIRDWLLVAVAFSAVLAGVEGLKPFADLRGPGTHGPLTPGASLSAINNVSERATVIVSEIPARIRVMAAHRLPWLVGAQATDDETAPQGRNWMVWPLAGGLAFAMLRTLTLVWRSGRRPSFSFAWYVLGIGLMGAAGYVATRVVAENTPRYYLLALFIPVGVTAVFLASEPQVWLRRAMLALVIGWTVLSGVDHAHLFARYDGGREPNEPREMADALEARRLHVAQSDYWRAYKLTFLTGERVKVASTDLARIDEYQKLAASEGDQLFTIEPQPCVGGEHLATWFLCRNP
jgi:hypothetical protein